MSQQPEILDHLDFETYQQHALPSSHYADSGYSSKNRYLLYWRHLRLVRSHNPTDVLEIGVGPGIVSASLRATGEMVTTADLNPALKPDVVSDIVGLERALGGRRFDLVFCSRVLHHVDLADLPINLAALAAVTNRVLILIVPQDVLALHLGVRVTGTDWSLKFVKLPRAAKRLVRFTNARVSRERTPDISGRWTLEYNISEARFKELLSRDFTLVSCFPLAEDPAHVVFELSPRRAEETRHPGQSLPDGCRQPVAVSENR